MTAVMVCGIRKREDVDILVEAGVDAVGLITAVWQAIPCNLSLEEARELSRSIPPFMSSVLVITEENVSEVCRMIGHVHPGVVQLHGFNTLRDVSTIKGRTGVKIIKTLHFQGGEMAEDGDPVKTAQEYGEAGADAVLLDSYQRGEKVGATGKTVDFSLAREIRQCISPLPLVLAGGLSADNVLEAVKAVKPYAVDVLSGVTSFDCIDLAKVKQFVQRARSG